jgi:hypothetical protein
LSPGLDRVLPGQLSRRVDPAGHTGFFLPLFFRQPGPVQAPGRPGPGSTRRAEPGFKTMVRSFLGHAGFYRRFIKYFSVISKSLCNLLTKDNVFEWIEHCDSAFVKLKNLLTSAPIIQPLDW